MGGKFAGHCQQTFGSKTFVDIPQQDFALLLQVNFPTNFWIFTEVEGDGIKFSLSSYIFSTLFKYRFAKWTSETMKKSDAFDYLSRHFHPLNRNI